MSAFEAQFRKVGALLEAVETDSAVSLSPITEAVGGSYSLLFRTGRDGIVAEGSCHGVDAGYVERLKEASHLHLLPPWLDRLEPGSVVDRAAFGSDRQFVRTDFCNHVVRPEGRFHCVIGTPLISGTDRFHLVVGRPHNRNEFDPDSRRLLRWMLPQVAEILRLRADLSTTRLCLDHAERALDGLQQPVFVVAPDATVISANATARRFVGLRDGIWCDGQDRLSTAALGEAGTLRDAIKRVAAGGGRSFLLVPRRIANHAPLRLTLSLLHEKDQSALGRGNVLVVADAIDTGNEEERIAGAARSFGLTRREREVVTLLVRGLTLKAAAHDLGMSYNTARSYVRQIFEKTAVNRQSDLLRLFATGHHPAGPARG